MPFLFARRPVRRGVLCAFRSRAAVEVPVRAGLDGWCANRSGLGLNVDLILRVCMQVKADLEAWFAFCWNNGSCDLAILGKRNNGGNWSPWREGLGGIVDMGRPTGTKSGVASINWSGEVRRSSDYRHHVMRLSNVLMCISAFRLCISPQTSYLVPLVIPKRSDISATGARCLEHD